MDLETFQLLLTPAGQALLQTATTLGPTDANLLSIVTKLQKDHPPKSTRAAIETVLLRQKARLKFSLAEQMYFTREALEQATTEVISSYRAERFAFSSRRVGDFCCGIGGDTLGLAKVGDVLAIDCDPVRLAMAEENCRVAGHSDCTHFWEGDVTEVSLDGLDGIFCDPGRRSGGQRHLSVRDYSPPLEVVKSWLSRVEAIGVKIAPGVLLSELNDYDAEQEFISFGGELRECVLWFGSLRSAKKRATVLPGPHTLTSEAPPPPPSVGPPLSYLYEPDPSILRSGLVTALAKQIDAHQLDENVAYLAAESSRLTPFAKCYAIEESMPFHARRLREVLRERRVGRVTIKRRGSAVDPSTLIKQLKLKGPEERVLFLTRAGDQPLVLIGTPALP
ncbi:MAG: class I SAM-dependent methyltransferase [Gemmataceae bacterium]